MSQFGKKSFSIALISLFAFSIATSAWAGDGENGVTDFFRKLFHYPGKAVQGAASTTAKTLNNTGEKVVSKAGENTSAILHGDVAKTGNLAGDAVVGTAETVGQTASETVQVPVQAAEGDTTQQ